MAKKEKNIPTSFIVIASVLFLCFAILLAFLVYQQKIQINQISSAVMGSQTALDSGNPNKAWRLLRSSVIRAESSSDWKQLMMQAYHISEETEDWNYLRKISAKALRHYKGREDFWAVYLSSLLWSGNYKKAVRERSRIHSESLEDISAELFLTQESLRLNPDIEPYSGVLGLLEQVKDPEYYEYIARLTGNAPLKADAALLWLLQGQLEKAYFLTKDLADPSIPDQLSGYIAYDFKDYELAQSYLVNQLATDKSRHIERWSLNALLGDISFLLNDYKTAEKYYLYSLELQGENPHWRPQLNLSVLYHLEGIEKISHQWMMDVMEQYEDTPEVLIHFTEFWGDQFPVVAERMINRYLLEHPQDTTMLLKQVLYFPKEMTPLMYNAFLWKLFNDNSSDKEVARFLVWYLMSMGHYDDALLVIDRHHRVDPLENWTAYYKAIILSLMSPDNWDEMKEILAQNSTANDGFIYYNRAVLEVKSGNGFKAMDLLNKAVHRIEQEGFGSNPRIRGQIESLYGQIYADLGDSSNAMKHILKALEYDENNAHARSLLLEIKQR